MIRKMIKKIRALGKNEKGFTLIELMVVVVIIGIIVGIALPQFTVAHEKARKQRAKAEIKNFKTVAMVIYAEDGTYPTGTDFSGMSDYNIPSTPKDPWGGSYSYSTIDGFTITDGSSKGISATPSSGP